MAGLVARLAGAALVVAGVALWSVPLAFVAAGVVLIVAGNEVEP